MLRIERRICCACKTYFTFITRLAMGKVRKFDVSRFSHLGLELELPGGRIFRVETCTGPALAIKMRAKFQTSRVG